MEDPRYFNFLRFIKLIIIYHGKIHQILNSNISKVSSSYPYNLFNYFPHSPINISQKF